MAAPKRSGARISHDHVKAQIEGLISDARSYDDGDRADRRRLALDYQAGRMPDLVPGEGKSSVVEQLLAESIDWLLPSLMRVFVSADNIAIYEPNPPSWREGISQAAFLAACEQNEAFASQATDYVNFVFLRECNGEKLLRDAVYDGLLHGNGVIKHWWDPTPEHRVESYTGLGDDAFIELVSDPDVEVLEHSERPDDTPAPDLPAPSVGPQTPALPPSPVGAPNGPQPPADAGSVADGLQPGQPPAPQMPMAGGAMGTPSPGNAFPPPVPGANPAGPADPLAAPVAVDGSAGGVLAPILGIGGNFGPPPLLHDLRIRRTVSTGRLRIQSLADEDFLIESAATALNEEECRFCAHLDTPTRSDLIARGYDFDLVMDLGTVTETEESRQRARRNWNANDDYEDKAGERVEVYECYALLDPDEDGLADWYQVVIGGPSGSREILDIAEWGGKLPFSDIVPDPIPHAWQGRSLYDRLRDPQRVATAISRRVLDNAYMVVEPQRAVNLTLIDNPDAVFDQTLGGIIRTKGDPRTAIMDLAVPFVAKDAAPLIDEQRRIAERRTGVGEQSSGLDADALSGQVATAVAATQNASGLRKEDYARNIQMGLRRAFTCMLRLMVENQDRPRMLQLRKQWVQMDPSAWSAEMDVTVNVGLGGGNRERDLAMLQGIAQKQELVLQTVGPKLGLDNPIMGLKEYFGTLRMMVEAAGVKAPERFFPEVDDATLKQITAQLAQDGQKPDPKAQAAQAQLQITAQKAQADHQLAQAKAQSDAQLNAAKMQQQQAVIEAKLQADMRVKEAEMQHRMEMDRFKAQQETMAAQQKAQIELQVQHAKAQAQLEMQREKAAADLHIRTMELQFEAQLKAAQTAAGINRQHATDLELPQ